MRYVMTEHVVGERAGWRVPGRIDGGECRVSGAEATGGAGDAQEVDLASAHQELSPGWHGVSVRAGTLVVRRRVPGWARPVRATAPVTCTTGGFSQIVLT